LSVIKLGNIPEADVLGAEAEINWLPTEHWQFLLGFSVLDTELGEFDSQIGPVASGNELPNAPDFSGIAQARYELPIGEYSLGLMANVRYSDDIFRDSLNQNLLATEAHTLVNANAELVSPDDSWKISVWGRNLTDEDVSQQAGNNGIGMGHTLTQQPKTFGVTFSYSYK